MHAHLRCRRCDLIFVADLPSHADLMAAYRRVHLSSYQVRHKLDWELWRRHKQLTLDTLGLPAVERSTPGGEALEVGCGEGQLLSVLQERGWRVRGVEVNASLAARARQLGHQVAVCSLEEAAPERQCSLVVMSHLLEHLRDPLQGLRRVRSWLQPGGQLVVETPLRPDYDNIDHLFCFSAAALDLALRRCGFIPSSWYDYVDDNYRHHNLACRAGRD